MRRKIIDDFWLSYLNDLFEIKLIILRQNFLNFYGRFVLQYKSLDASFFSISRFQQFSLDRRNR